MKSRSERITAASPATKVLAFVAGSSLLQAEDPARALGSRLVCDHACKCCGTVVTASASSTPDPFCFSCGSEEMELVSATYEATEVLGESPKLAGVNCSHCSFTTVVHASVLDAVGCDGSFCASCGNPMYVTASVEPTPKSEMTNPDQTTTEVATASIEQTTAAAADLSAGPEAEGETPSGLKGVGEHLGQTNLDGAPESPNAKSQPEVAASKCGPDTDMKDPTKTITADAEGASAALSSLRESSQSVMEVPEDLSYAENFSQYRGDEPHIPGMNGSRFDMSETTTGQDMRVVPKNNLHLSSKIEASVSKGIPALDALGIDDRVTGCSFVQIDDVLVAMKDHQSIATLTARGAKHNAGVMFTDAFPGIVAEKMSKEGVRAALSHFGFDQILVPVKTAASFKAELNTATTAVREEYAARENAMADSMAIAAVGLSRGTWRNASNPLMEGITDALTRAGVVNAAKVSAGLMAKYGLEYSRTLASVASELSARTEESRRELAAMHDLIDDKVAQEDISPEINTASLTFPSSVEGRLSQAAATPRQTHQVAALLRPGTANAGLSPEAQAVLEGRVSLFNL